jgi:hypothetical protein
MTVSALSRRTVGRINNPTELGVPDLAFKRLQIGAQLLAETPELSQEIRSIALEQLPDLRLFIGRGGMTKFNQQQSLLMQVLIARLIKRDDQGFDVVGDPAKIAQQITIVPILWHNRWWRGCVRCRHRPRANQVCHGCGQRQQDSEWLHITNLLLISSAFG